MKYKKRIDTLNGKTSPSSEKSNSPILFGDDNEGFDSSLLMDNFLSQLGGIISLSIRHLVIPPTPLFEIRFTERVIFHLFIIQNHQKYKATKYFNYALFKQEIAKLKLPSQEFSFSLKTINMNEDPLLMTAFSSSLHSSVIPKLNAVGEFSTQTLLYLNSKEIRHHLKILHPDDDATEEDYENKFLSKHIPIFFFSVDSDVPVFIDKYYQAKALSDMVIVVQSNFTSWESRLSCNKDSINWDLRNPIKSALSATSVVVGGLVPYHVGYSEASSRAYQNWLWSVGDNPLSYTSQHFFFSEIHRDIAFRNYIVTALNDSVEIINEGVNLLLSQKTNMENAAAIDLLYLTNISSTYLRTKELWIDIARSSQKLDYTHVASKLKEIYWISRKFRDYALESAQTLDLYKCINGEKAEMKNTRLEWLLSIAIAMDLIVLLLFILFKKKKSKVKIN